MVLEGDDDEEFIEDEETNKESLNSAIAYSSEIIQNKQFMQMDEMYNQVSGAPQIEEVSNEMFD